MATVKVNTNNQDYTNNSDGFDLTGGTTRRKLTVSGGDVARIGDASAYQYYQPNATTQTGIIPAYQFITLTTAYTGTSTTSFQQMFNAPANGAVTAAANTTYFWECEFSLSSMSTTSGTFSFGFLGTATFTRARYWALALKGATTPTGVLIMTNTAAAAISAATTTATGHAKVRGKIVIGAAGTIIPAFAVSVAAAAVVGVDSYFRIWAVGSNTVQSVGNWS